MTGKQVAEKAAKSLGAALVSYAETEVIDATPKPGDIFARAGKWARVASYDREGNLIRWVEAIRFEHLDSLIASERSGSLGDFLNPKDGTCIRNVRESPARRTGKRAAVAEVRRDGVKRAVTWIVGLPWGQVAEQMDEVLR